MEMNSPNFNPAQLAFLKQNLAKWDFSKPLADEDCDEVLQELGHLITTVGFDNEADSTNAFGDMCEAIVDRILEVYNE